MAQAAARYRQTGTQRSNATNWPTGGVGLWYNSAEKVSPMVTKTDEGTPSVSKFTLNANGMWLINANNVFGAVCTLYLSTADAATNAVGGGAPGVSCELNVVREFNFAQNVWVRAYLASSTTMGQADPQMNWVSFTFLGAI